MNIDDAYSCVTGSLTVNVGKFYAPGTSLALGKGAMYRPVLYPVYDEEQAIFLSVAGLVYVLTHECDVEQENVRLFNRDLLICPIIPLEHLVEEYLSILNEDHAVSFLTNLGARNIPRLLYVPAWPPVLRYGGVMYLNHIANTSVAVFHAGEAQLIAAVTGYGLEIVERMLENHLLRPKADRLAFVEERP
jgi:hypothetical protein